VIDNDELLVAILSLFRLASRSNSDNRTEQRAHERMGASTVQVFGDLSPVHRARGWMTVEELYALHERRLDDPGMLREVVKRFRAA
jgi:hypothetical protein